MFDMTGTSMEIGFRGQGTGRSNYNYELRIMNYWFARLLVIWFASQQADYLTTKKDKGIRS
jgi:hypothetical protein